MVYERTLNCGKSNSIIEPNCCLCEGWIVIIISQQIACFIVVHDHSRGYMTNFIDLSCPDKTWHKKCRTTTILAWSHCSNNKVTTKYMLGKRETYIIFSLILRLFSISHVHYIWCVWMRASKAHNKCIALSIIISGYEKWLQDGW